MRTTFIYLDYRRRTSLAHGLLRVNKWLGYLRDLTRGEISFDGNRRRIPSVWPRATDFRQ
jgi:hypothetical protein